MYPIYIKISLVRLVRDLSLKVDNVCINVTRLTINQDKCQCIRRIKNDQKKNFVHCESLYHKEIATTILRKGSKAITLGCEDVL